MVKDQFKKEVKRIKISFTNNCDEIPTPTTIRSEQGSSMLSIKCQSFQSE